MKKASKHFMRSFLSLMCISFLVACVEHSIALPEMEGDRITPNTYAQTIDKDVDILFVIDNSPSMVANQKNLSDQFPVLIDALTSSKLGGKLPNIHVGVISTDLGVETSMQIETCGNSGGGNGKLQNQPRRGGCIPPNDPWISYKDGQTNVPSSTSDPIQQVKETFSCIAELGTEGCAFEHQIEAAHRALDPKQNVNPDFIRPDALLVVVFITDEDDCSASDADFYALPIAGHQEVQVRSDFRCFSLGVTCDVADPIQIGPRKNCKPAGNYLHKIEEYKSFFSALKPPGRVLLAAIAGPTDTVEVNGTPQKPELAYSCRTLGRDFQSAAVPAVRIKALVDSFGADGQFTSICTENFGPALKRLGDLIVANLGAQCVGPAPLTPSGALACSKGDVIGTDGAGKQMICNTSCLAQSTCSVEETIHLGGESEKPTRVSRCPAEKFIHPEDRSWDTSDPCWRLVFKTECSADGSSPYALDILRKGEAPKGTVAKITCSGAFPPSGTSAFAALPQCE